MPNKGDSAPATKTDIKLLIEQIRDYYDKTERRIAESELSMKQHFDVSLEQIHHEMKSANREEIEVLKDGKKDHEKRIKKIEMTLAI